jgi:multiple sugar transport system permease protein
VRRGALADAASYAALALASFIALFPIFWTISTSLKYRVDTYSLPPKFLVFDYTLKNYRSLFRDPTFVHAVWVTVGVTLVSSALSVAAGALCGYALARQRRFAGRRPLEASLVFVRALPGIVIVIPLFDLLNRVGLYNNLATLVLIYAALNVPFAAWLMTSFMRQVPFELEESARVDGGGRLTVLVRVVLPLALPGLAATFIFVALLAWNEFLVPALLVAGQNKTLPVYISTFVSNRNLDWGPMAAASAVALVPIAVLTIAVQRHLVAGLSSGAVKE